VRTMVLVDLWGDEFWKGVEKTVKDGQSSNGQEVQKNLPLRQKPVQNGQQKPPENQGFRGADLDASKTVVFGERI